MSSLVTGPPTAESIRYEAKPRRIRPETQAGGHRTTYLRPLVRDVQKNTGQPLLDLIYHPEHPRSTPQPDAERCRPNHHCDSAPEGRPPLLNSCLYRL